MVVSKNKVRLLAALLFSIIFHAVIISILYLESKNVKNDDKGIRVSGSEPNIVDFQQLNNSKIDENTAKLEVNTQDTENKEISESKESNPLQDKLITESQVEVVESKTDNSISTEVSIDPNISTNIKGQSTSQDMDNQLQTHYSIENEVTEDEKILRDEIERIDTQLSIVIHEVKKRNQQNIDQMRQQQNYTDVY